MTVNRLDVLRKSFVPVTLVIAALFLMLFAIQLKVAMDADKVTVIKIERIVQADIDPEGVDGAVDEPVVEFSHEKSVDPLYESATALVEQEKWGEAEKIYKAILRKGESSHALNDLGLLYYKKDELDAALETLNRAASMEPVYSSVLFNRAVVLTALGRNDEALADYAALLRKIPYHFEANYNTGVLLMRKGDLEGSLKALNTAIESSGGARKSKALFTQGLVYRKMGPDRHTLAAESFERAIRLQPDNIRARFMLAVMEPDTKEGRKRALSQYKKIINLQQNYTPAYFNMAMIQSDMGRRKQAIDTYNTAIRFNPGYFKARYNLGLLLLAEKRFNDARGQYEWLIKHDGDDGRNYFNLARALYGEKDYEGAIKNYRKAIEVSGGDYPEAYLNIGRTYSAMKDYDSAVKAYRRALDIRATYPEAWYNLAIVHLRRQEYGAAEKAFKTAISQDPEYSQAWFNLGVLYAREDNDDAAIEAYGKVLELRPKYKPARLNLAVRYAHREEFGKAIELYKSVLEMDDSYANAWINLGLAYYKTGDDKDAEEAFVKAQQLEPGEYKPKLYLARVMVRQKRFGEAVGLLEEVVDINPTDAGLRVELAAALRADGRRSEAKTELEKGLRLQPDSEIIKKELEEDY